MANQIAVEAAIVAKNPVGYDPVELTAFSQLLEPAGERKGQRSDQIDFEFVKEEEEERKHKQHEKRNKIGFEMQTKRLLLVPIVAVRTHPRVERRTGDDFEQ